MTTELVLATKLDILKQTRDLFAQTHWTSGDLYTIDKTGKKRFCMVGGLCHIMVKNNLPEWLSAEEEKMNPKLSFYMYEIQDDRLLKGYDPEVFLSGMDAEWELAKTICLKSGHKLDPEASPQSVEDIIVGWNDGEADIEFETRGDASYVLEIMDETIERVEREENESL